MNNDIEKKLFPTRREYYPQIYAYKDNNPNHAGLLKIGYTEQKNVEDRIRQQFPVLQPEERPYTIVFSKSSMREDGTTFTDHDIHKLLKKHNFENPNGEWFRCNTDDINKAYNSIFMEEDEMFSRTQTFGLRPEQEKAIEKTKAYFESFKATEKHKVPHFLWNAKMRFGKTFTAYELAKQMRWNRLLILTFKPAVENAWEEDLIRHVDFEGWQFVARDALNYDDCDKSKPIVCFGSFQDYLGKNSAGGIKLKNEWVHQVDWDCVILDEYHYGAWRESAKELFESEDAQSSRDEIGEGLEYYDESIMPITTSHYLYLSGTPFRAISSGEFIEEQIYNWTYSDEQKSKESWDDTKGPNPYISLPKMVLMTYQLPESITEIAEQGEFNEFDLNTFFYAEGIGEDAHFKYENEVQKWLDLIRGSYLETTIDNLKLGAKKPPMPFSDTRLMSVLNHTVWFLPSVSACYAMNNLLKQRQNTFYHDYRVNVAAGVRAGIGVQALAPVRQSMQDPLHSKSITLTCGKLTTGVTVKPWGGIFMLRNLNTPETYFQAAFRVQSPWVLKSEDVTKPDEILKKVAYIFDFAPNRALRQISDYSCRLDINEANPEKKVADFIKFLPVLAYDGSSMKQIDAAGILDITMSGTTATLLAKRWESALLVNVDDLTLERLFGNEKAMQALMNIEGFRRLNKDLETIINKSQSIKDKKMMANDRDLTKKEKQTLSEEEREYKSKRKQIQEKLIKFATRIPIFMYLTDYRERTLKDVITQLEPGLFQKVTGLTVEDFELLVSLGVFNGPLMNDAVFKFKRYEDSSLVYSGINRHGKDVSVGLFDTTISVEEFKENN